MDPATVARWRLANQLLTSGGTRSAAEVVGRLAAVQAQDLLPSAWSLAQRAGGVTREAVADEITLSNEEDGVAAVLDRLFPERQTIAP